MPDQHVVKFPSGHIVTFPAGMPEKQVAREAAHIHHFSLSKLGAPADFGGPVFSNPKGLKPQLDTDKPKSKATPLVGTKMDISNAPVSSTNPPLTRHQESPGQPRMNIDKAPLNPGIEPDAPLGLRLQ